MELVLGVLNKQLCVISTNKKTVINSLKHSNHSETTTKTKLQIKTESHQTPSARNLCSCYDRSTQYSTETKTRTMLLPNITHRGRYKDWVLWLPLYFVHALGVSMTVIPNYEKLESPEIFMLAKINGGGHQKMCDQGQ